MKVNLQTAKKVYINRVMENSSIKNVSILAVFLNLQRGVL